MDELKQAYETLGLPENATREQVEQRYFILLKKARSKQTELNLDEITRAYNLIVGVESEKSTTLEKQSKVNYFFYYYKYHVLAAIVILIVAIVSVKGYIDRKNEEANKPPLDLAVTVFGNFYNNDDSSELLSRNLLRLVPDWKRIDVGISYIPKELQSQQDIAMQQKGMLTIMTEKMDLMILDEKNFEQLAKQKAFVPLDTLEPWQEWNRTPERIRSVLAEEETSSHPYGIDITGSPIFDGTQIESPGEKRILVMRAEPPHKDKALRLMKLITELK
ncbi:hypothetical protein GE107_18145 [Cohnella sp. CFH 77786]|uniref:hypothetical protein n=1 Tax=Cohnella sp. CFH 77786 TaxID=2662265 RepID=UPI001C60DC38|nr:hypothetical protein [Cohnella sp. CFH 77786]MBW5447980.1 hypothetical protein [Cohnella sp. CFH 77786]